MPGSTAIKGATATGRAARKVVPRRTLAEWDPARRACSALEILFSQHAERVPDLLPIRYGRMSTSPWTYLRGAAAVMAADLDLSPNTGLTVQLCGDAHVLNYGLWASPERNLLFDLRDFDETLPGPFEWDVKRLAASLVVCAQENALPDNTAGAAVTAAVASYQAHMRSYARMSELDVWYDRIDASTPLASLAPRDRKEVRAWVAEQAEDRTSAGAFRKMTEIRDGRRRIIEKPPFRVHLDRPEHRDEAEIARQVFETYSSSVPEQLIHLFDRFTLSDVVRQVVGVGSVGMRVFLLLAEGRSGEAPLFLQVKQAGASVYEAHLEPSAQTNHGHRVVLGQHLMQSATDLFTGWTRLDGLDFYVRQFRDMKVIPDGRQITPYLTEFAGACAHALAKAHARTGDPAAIAAYIGKGSAFAHGIGEFAQAYASQTRADHADLVAAIAASKVETAPGW
ncbi:DUF2252 domain-containing protein [Nocardia jiangxiensis]|uniref:DUF2252 domain-containing protein n=1 Tax=Nocardia jiangxiensis TaxID=282685 RepID=UPI000314681B|nr:DUF2252 domain-containing protein [Nocardia jiangxiensis]